MITVRKIIRVKVSVNNRSLFSFLSIDLHFLYVFTILIILLELRLLTYVLSYFKKIASNSSLLTDKNKIDIPAGIIVRKNFPKTFIKL